MCSFDLVIIKILNLWEKNNLGGRGHKYPFLEKQKNVRFFFTAWTFALVNRE